MGKRSKSKGSSYEREFVQRVQDAGLPARRVPLSGAMAGYKDDVVVCDDFRIECKFRRDGAGFSRLHGWIEGMNALELPASGLIVMKFENWIALTRRRVDTADHTLELTEGRIGSLEVSAQKGLLGWLGEADALALRRVRSPWLMVERMPTETGVAHE
jgi:hypothetical protein